MRSIRILLPAVIIMIFIFSCKKEDPEGMIYKDISLTPEQKNLVSTGNSFAFDILKQVSENEEPDKNLMISPLSISYALGMTVNGAKNQTLEQMLDVLGFEQSLTDCNEYFRYLYSELVGLDPKVDLSVANSIWYRLNFNVLDSFLEVNRKYYNSEITSLDFDDPEAKDIINQWVNDATNGKIKSIIDDGIDPSAVMYLINAIYFYGNWKYTFDPQETYNETFYLSNGNTIQSPMMHQEAGLNSAYLNDIGTAVELPYGRGNFAMLLIKPIDENTPEDIVQQLNPENWASWLSQLDTANINIVLPKFRFEYERILNDDLSLLGMTDAFSDHADFSGINGTGGLYISEVKHKTFIRIDEEGTEAAAVTSVAVNYTSAGSYSTEFNRPFLFFIYEKSTGAVLFAGKVEDPLN